MKKDAADASAADAATDALLHASELSTVLSVVSKSLVCYALPKPSSVRAITRPIQVVAAIAPGDEAERWRRLWKQLKQARPDASCFVRQVQVCTRDAHTAPIFRDGAGKHASGVSQMLQRSHTRCISAQSAPDTLTLPDPSEMDSLASELAAAVGCSGGLASADDARLIVVCVCERWMRAGASSAEYLTSIQLEGFAPASLRGAIEAAATRHLALKRPSMDAFGRLETGGVAWHASVPQSALCGLRWQRAIGEGAPPPRDSPAWLDAIERMCSHTPAGGLLGVLHGRPSDDTVPAPLLHDWRAGRTVLSLTRPRIELYPAFLSTEECDHLLRRALAHAESIATASPSGGGYVSSASNKMRAVLPPDDPLVEIVEERCAAATGVPRHGDERAVELKLTNEEEPQSAAAGGPDEAKQRMMPSLHVDTNNGGIFRCATVIIYLSDMPEGMGGETRFPIANQPAESAVRAAGEATLRAGATVLRPGASAEADILLDVAESATVGVHVRPRRGAACCFWTMNADGVDPSSWHNGAAVRHGGGGKIIAQKFKELPAEYRRDTPLRLPSCLPPPHFVAGDEQPCVAEKVPISLS